LSRLPRSFFSVGFPILPLRRRRAKAVLQEKIAAVGLRLAAALRAEFETAQQQGQRRLADASAPYARFVRAEEERWRGAQQRLADLRARLAALLTSLRAGQ
jgi:hypothetical protein